jgi:hypothetical protein
MGIAQQSEYCQVKDLRRGLHGGHQTLGIYLSFILSQQGKFSQGMERK